jgi:hypothetical protein
MVSAYIAKSRIQYQQFSISDDFNVIFLFNIFLGCAPISKMMPWVATLSHGHQPMRSDLKLLMAILFAD